jgi:hypothetical protein
MKNRRIAFTTTLLALACFGLSATAQAVTPAPDGGYPNQNTAEGENALFSLTGGLGGNTAIGFQALFSNTTGPHNTATGDAALYSNTTGIGNTATGYISLYSNTTGRANSAYGSQTLRDNTTGDFNTADGAGALSDNTTGFSNTATGAVALTANTEGFSNTANGTDALFANTTGSLNTATGAATLQSNTTGDQNTAAGAFALSSNTTGFYNTANGLNALSLNITGNRNTAFGRLALYNNTSGSRNIALGNAAGFNLITGDDNIDIGNQAVGAESGTIRIGTLGTQTATYVAGIMGKTVPMSMPVFVNANGQLGTTPSSARFKDQIKPMDNASEAILALKPVTFRYKKELDPEGIPQFGLVAEDVEKVNPALVARDADGKVYTVRYEAVNAMLLNEFLKEHRAVQELKSTVAKQAALIAQQQTEMETVVARLTEQDSKIQRVSDHVEMSKPAPRMVLNP